MRRDGFLTGILAGIGVLILASLVLFVTRDRQMVYVDENTPEGVARNYLLALQRRDYTRAYSYLASGPERPTELEFRRVFQSGQGYQVTNTAVEQQEALVVDEYAEVTVVLLQGGQGPFAEIYRESTNISLVKEDAGWKIFQAPYPFWSYDWIYPGKSD